MHAELKAIIYLFDVVFALNLLFLFSLNARLSRKIENASLSECCHHIAAWLYSHLTHSLLRRNRIIMTAMALTFLLSLIEAYTTLATVIVLSLFTVILSNGYVRH